jgi:hypothetical protein
MVGFIEEDYQIVEIHRASRTAFIVTGWNPVSQQTTSRTGNFRLFLRVSSDLPTAETATRLTYTANTHEVGYHVTQNGETSVCKPIRRKKQYTFEANQIRQLKSQHKAIQVENALPMLLAQDTIATLCTYQSTCWSTLNLQTQERHLFDFREMIPLYISDAEAFDRLQSADEIRQKRRKLLDFESILQHAAPFFPFAVVTSYPWIASLQTTQYGIISNAEQLYNVVNFAIQSNFDILWNITKRPTTADFTTPDRLACEPTRGVFIDLDQLKQSAKDTLQIVSTLAKTAGWTICAVESSASKNGLHLFLQPSDRHKLKLQNAALNARIFICNLVVKLKVFGIESDVVSQRPLSFFFLPGVPILKKEYGLSDGMTILEEIV